MSSKIWGLIVDKSRFPSGVIRDIGYVMAFAFLAMGVIIMTPFYPMETRTVFNLGLDTNKWTLPVAYIISSLMIIVGSAVANRWLSCWGFLLLSMATFFAAFLRVLTFGVFPLYWVPVGVVSLIAARIYVYGILNDGR